MSLVYFIIIMLFLVYIFWTWNSTKEFETITIRISYVVIGTIFMAFITFLLFLFSRIGVTYPSKEMVGEVRNIILLVFTPINGFIMLPKLSYAIAEVKNGTISKEDLQKKIRKILIIAIVLIIFEVIYFKSIQNEIIDFINLQLEKK